NSLLRCFQFISPETIPYGRFCWNQECQYCRVSCQLPDDDEAREMLSCKFIVMPGMEVTELSQELKWCLRSKLPSDLAVPKEAAARSYSRFVSSTRRLRLSDLRSAPGSSTILCGHETNGS